MIHNSFQTLGITEIVKDTSEEVIEQLVSLKHVFDDMQSERKVQKLYKRLERFVSHETIKIGRHGLSNKYKTAQYISIQKAIQSLVLDPELAEVFPGTLKVVRSNEKFTVFTRNIKLKHIFKKADCPKKQ
jgi:hypothetical protein